MSIRDMTFKVREFGMKFNDAISGFIATLKCKNYKITIIISV